MSYRSLKRVLGETSLERKCRFLFGASLLLLITASFWWYGSQTEHLVNYQNRITGERLVDQVMLIKHWRGMETENKDLKYLDLIKTLAEKLNNQKYTWEFIRPDETGGEGTPRDEFEWGVLDRFRKAKPERTADPDHPPFDERLTGDGKYVYYQPIYADKSCVICHNIVPGGFDLIGSGLALGRGVSSRATLAEDDLMAIVKVIIPNERVQHNINVNRATLLATAIITVFLAMITSYAIVRYVIVKPLRHLRDVSDAISKGNMSLRAEIHTGDEFEALAMAFNRMLRHLMAVQGEIRQVNVDLDAKVDELAQANMRLYEMNMIKSDFLATMSHELRTPLNSILGFSEVLGSIDSLNDKQKRYVQNIQTSGRMLLDMINDILDLAKIESGKMDVRLTDFRIEQVIRAQCDMARPLTEKKNIDLEIGVVPDLPPMRQDQARVQQILNNLLSNAIKFTPEGGRITVSAARETEAWLLMQVTDTGVGIAEEDQQSIFEKFRQGRTAVPGNDALTREHSGSGLGLSIVKELCKLLGGEVSVQSELGRGSTFTMRLPWTLQEQPRLDSALVEEFEEFTKPRLELLRERRLAGAEE